MRALFVALILACVAPVAWAQEQPVTLKDAPGRETVETNCAGCHSLDYPRINSPFLDRKGWTAEVTKMINVFGAPIAPKDAAVIVDYLVTNYGKGS